MTTDEQQDWAKKRMADLSAEIAGMAPSEREHYLCFLCVELHTKLIEARETIVELTAEISELNGAKG